MIFFFFLFFFLFFFFFAFSLFTILEMMPLSFELGVIPLNHRNIWF